MVSYYQSCYSKYEGVRSERACFSADLQSSPFYDFTAAVVPMGGGATDDIFSPPENWTNQINVLAASASCALDDDSLIYQPPGLSREQDPARRLRNPIGLSGLDEVTETIVSQLEKKLYGCHVAVDKVHIFRQLPCADRISPFESWAWHADGHPAEFIKVAVYLNDVTEGCSVFELLWSESRRRALRAVAYPMDADNWVDGEGRFGNEFDDKFVADAHARGYVKRSIYGRAGTTVVFATNCVHRGTVGRKGVRDTLILRLRPVPLAQNPRLRQKSSIGDYTKMQLSAVG